jgi:hypothetical protein
MRNSSHVSEKAREEVRSLHRSVTIEEKIEFQLRLKNPNVVVPGFQFYKDLVNSSLQLQHLCLPLPETLVVTEQGFYLLTNNEEGVLECKETSFADFELRVMERQTRYLMAIRSDPNRRR